MVMLSDHEDEWEQEIVEMHKKIQKDKHKTEINTETERWRDVYS
jgi:hypothetical protein